MAVDDLTSLLDRAGVPYDVLQHEHTETGLAEAHALAVSADEVAKTLILDTPSGHVRAVIPASRRIDMRKAAEHLDENRHDIHLTTEGTMKRDYPEFELGAVPPLGGSGRDRVVIDARLLELDTVVFEAGAHDRSVRLATSDLLNLTGADTADICHEE